MPVSELSFAPVLAASLASKSITGSSSIQLSSAIAQGLSNYILGPLTFNSVTTGTLGTGVGANIPGTIQVPSQALTSSIYANFLSQSISGSSSLALAQGVASGISNCFLLCTPNIASPTVGVGSGIGTFFPTSCIPFMSAAFASKGLTGTSAFSQASAIANAVDLILAVTPVNVIIAGSPSIIPSGGLAVGGKLF